MMVNSINNVSEGKVDKAVNVSLTKQSNAERQNVITGQQSSAMPNESVNTPDVSVIINGEEKTQANNKDQKKEVTSEDAKKISDALNEFMEKLNCDIQFKYNDKLEFMTIKMIDKKTKEVIREFPPDELLKTMEKTQEWIGIFLDRKA